MDYSNPRLNEVRVKRLYKSTAKKTQNKIMVIILRIAVICVLVGGVGGAMVVLGAYLSIIERAPNVSQIFVHMAEDTGFNSVIVNWRGEELVRLSGEENRDFAPSHMIPEHVKLAFVAREDERFYEHDGIDFRGMLRAVWASLVDGRNEGASTITQQVVKMKIGVQRNTFESKLQEQVLALNLEQELTEMRGSKAAAKDFILEIYLNSIHLGMNANGVQAASLLYFGKNVWELNLSEAAVLAAITTHPTTLNPIRRPQNNANRRETVLDNMLRLGFITREEFNEAMEDDVYARVTGIEQIQQTTIHTYFTDEIIRQVRRDLMREYNMTHSDATRLIFGGGLTITSTMDERIQAIVDNAYNNSTLFHGEHEIRIEWTANIRNIITGITRRASVIRTVRTMAEAQDELYRIRRQNLREGDVIVTEVFAPVIQPQSAFAMIDHTNGHVVAFAGGRGDKFVGMGLNRIMYPNVRQPGSTFKTFVYAAGLDMGILTNASVFDDVPTYYENPYGGEGWSPRNWYSGPFRGLHNVRTGMAQSMNIIAVKALDAVGIEPAFNFLHDFGFTTLVHADMNRAPVALGGTTHGVTVLELTAAYATIANNGTYIEPVFYTRVLAHDGTILLDNTIPRERQVIRPTTAFLLTETMVETVTTGTGTRARIPGNIPTAGKTGTTSDVQDQRFAGYTPYYTAAVWVGYDRKRNMSSAMRNAAVHLNLWRHIMDETHRTIPAPHRRFDVPPGVERHLTCRDSGLLPIPGVCFNEEIRGDRTRQEWFEVGTEPREFCNVHVQFRICVGSGQHGVSEWARPTQYCPHDHTTMIVGIRRPIPYYGEASIADRHVEEPRHFCTQHTMWGTQHVTVIPSGQQNMDDDDQRDHFQNLFGPPGD